MNINNPTPYLPTYLPTLPCTHWPTYLLLTHPPTYLPSYFLLIIHYMTSQQYIWLVFYDLSLMTIGWKMPYQTFNDYLSFATCPLQVHAFSCTIFDMTTKLFIYGVIDLWIEGWKVPHNKTLKFFDMMIWLLCLEPFMIQLLLESLQWNINGDCPSMV